MNLRIWYEKSTRFSLPDSRNSMCDKEIKIFRKIPLRKRLPAHLILLRSIAAGAIVPLKRRGGFCPLRGVRKKSKKMQENGKKRQKMAKNVKCWCFKHVNSGCFG